MVGFRAAWFVAGVIVLGLVVGLAATGVMSWAGAVATGVLVSVLGSVAKSALPWVRRKLRPMVTDAPPFQVQVTTDIEEFDWRGRAVHWPEYVVPKDVAEMPAPPDETDRGRWRWAHELGGCDANQTLIRLQLTGVFPEPVVVQSIRAIVGRSQPLNGCYVGFEGKGAPVSVRTVILDLDNDSAPVEFWPTEDGPKPFTLSLGQHETEVIDVLAYTNRHHCTWRLRLGYTYGGTSGSVTIDDHGRPFQTTWAGPLQLHEWNAGQWHTFPQP
jgi:hypothetical protein